LHLFEPETGQKRDSFGVPLDPATGSRQFAFTPDGQKLAIVKNNNTLIELWDVKQGRLLRTSSPERPIGQTLAFNEDGRYLSALTGTGMRVYDTETDTEELRKVGEYNAASPNESRDVQAFLPGHSVLASPSSTRRGVLIRDFLRKENLYVLEEKSEVRRALFSAGGDFLLTQSGDGVNLYSLRRAKERLVLPGHPSNVNRIAFGPDGSRLASVSADHTIRMWDADSGERIWNGDLIGEGGQALAFSPDGRRLATGCNASHVVQLWDTETGTEVLPIPPNDDDPDARWQRIKAKGDWTWGLAFVTDKEKGLLLCRRSFHIMEAWQIGDALGGEPEAVHDISFSSLSGTEIDLPRHTEHTFSSPSNLTIAIVEQPETKSCCLVKDPFGSTPAIVSIPWHVESCITSDGRALVALIEDEHGRQVMRVALIDVATGRQVRDFTVPGENANSRRLALSSKERWLALTTQSGRGVDIYDFATGERQYTLPASQASVSQLAWDPSDEARLAIALDSGDVSIWNLEYVDQALSELGLAFLRVSDN
jgi:WD40 repeat protein